MPDQHAAFGITRATQAKRVAAWQDLGMEELVRRGPGGGEVDWGNGSGSGGMGLGLGVGERSGSGVGSGSGSGRGATVRARREGLGGVGVAGLR